MSTKQGRVVVCDHRLPPALPAIIVEIDGFLYLDIDSAIQTVTSFQEPPSWRDDLLLLRWMWRYDTFTEDKYYFPAHHTILVDWAISRGTNRRLGIKAAWEEVADDVFTEIQGKHARFGIDYGTYDVTAAAYNTSNRLNGILTIREDPEEILAQQLAQVPIHKINIKDTPPHYKLQYKLYGLYKRLTQLFSPA
jgi:hypothetical protein